MLKRAWRRAMIKREPQTSDRKTIRIRMNLSDDDIVKLRRPAPAASGIFRTQIRFSSSLKTHLFQYQSSSHAQAQRPYTRPTQSTLTKPNHSDHIPNPKRFAQYIHPILKPNTKPDPNQSRTNPQNQNQLRTPQNENTASGELPTTLASDSCSLHQ